MSVVLDTYAWIEYFLGSEEGKIVESYLKKDPITPFIVLLELSYRADKEVWDFRRYLDFIKINSRITGLNEKFILKFGSFYNRTKKEIPTIGIADVIVLLTANEEKAKILTGDEHFKNIPDTIFLR
ncbi:MAG: PIN domain-containing protein [Nanoarchaeota archaeon]